MSQRKPVAEDQHALSGGVDIIDLARILAAGKWVVLAFAFCGLVAAYVVVRTSEPKFVVEATLLPADREANGGPSLGGLAGVGALVDLGSGVSQDTSEALTVLASREFTLRFLKANALLPRLLPGQWDAAARAWRPRSRSMLGRIADGLGVAATRDETRPGMPDVSLALRRFSEMRGVNIDKDSGVVTLTLEWTNPVEARDWLNGMVRMLNEHMRAEAISNSRRRVAYLKAELATAQLPSIQQAMTHIITRELQNAMIANVDREFAFRIVDPAVAPTVSTKPRRMVLLSMGLIGGVLIGVFVVIFHSYLRALKRARMAVE